MSSKGFDALNKAIKDATAKAGEAFRHVPPHMKGNPEVRDEAPPVADLAATLLMAYCLSEGANICQITEMDHAGVRVTFRVTCELVDAKPANGSTN